MDCADQRWTLSNEGAKSRTFGTPGFRGQGLVRVGTVAMATKQPGSRVSFAMWYGSSWEDGQA